MRTASRDQFVEQVSATIPLRRPGTPEEMAGLIVFLCSELAGYITGQWIAVDGGLLRGTF
jgi:3-oxoacyl-[acyl-carrier protein] reductase